MVSVEVDLQYIASYDNTYDNGDGTIGTYILDPGTISSRERLRI